MMKFKTIINYAAILMLGANMMSEIALAGGGSKEPQISNRAIEIMNLIDIHDYEHLGGPEATNLALSALLEVDNNAVAAKCLDVGSGTGGNTNYIKANGFTDIIGVDLNEEAVEKAKEKYPNIVFLPADALDLPDAFKEESFGAIFLFNVASEVSDKAELLQKLKAVCKTGGHVVIMDYKKPFAKEVIAQSQEQNKDEDKAEDKNKKAEPLINLSGNAIHPLAQEEIDLFSRFIGFDIVKRVDVSDDYINWYKKLLDNTSQQPNLLLAADFSQEEIDLAVNKYNKMHSLFSENKLGAEIIIMRKR